MPKATRTKRTVYQRLVSAKARHCKGTATISDVKKVAAAYVKNAGIKAAKGVAKGQKSTVVAKARAAATVKANAVLRRGCKTSSYIAGKKKKRVGRPRRKRTK